MGQKSMLIGLSRSASAFTVRLFDRSAWPRVPPKLLARYLIAAFTLTFLLSSYFLWYDTKTWDRAKLRISPHLGGAKHPIQKLMVDAKAEHENLLAQQSHDVETAAERYRERRGRHPPPGFDKWFQYAKKQDAIIVEQYFDRIYKDLTPFWALDIETVRNRANAWTFVVRVRNGTASGAGDTTGLVPWLDLWTGLVEEFAEHLPDVDMPINYMDESRLLVPYDVIGSLVEQESQARVMLPAEEMTSTYHGLADVDAQKPETYNPHWYGPDSKYWGLAVKTCGPDTAAYGVEPELNLSGPAQFPKFWNPEYSFKGYVQNWTAAMDFCLQPHLRQLHGTFIEPISLSSSEELIPMFSGSKLLRNNEIVIPGAMYLTEGKQYSGGSDHGHSWRRKKTGVVWRGAASGGRTHEDSWQHFQRHRLVDMLNATTVSIAERESGRAMTFEFPDYELYRSSRQARGEMGEWIKNFADAGFGWICPEHECDFIHPYFHTIKEIPMDDQYGFKFLPDADGNSFSARFRAFMRSTSLPLKATVYAEWHDDRLQPWVHFVPLDNTFRDLYPALEYFGDDNGQGDAAAEFIAESGRQWAEAALRREDMALYTWRLLLEWARLCDDNRDKLGYVDDLLAAKS